METDKRDMELIVPSHYAYEAGLKLHNDVDQMIHHGMPAYIKQSRRWFKTTFVLTYSPQNLNHLKILKLYEASVQNMVSRMNSGTN